MKNTRLPLLLWGLLAFMLISLSGVVIADKVSHNAPAQTAPQAATTKLPENNIIVGNKIGMTAPEFTLKTIDGREINLSDYRGKNVLLNFWATWCGPCRFEISTMEALQEAWADKDVVVLGVNVQDGFDNASNYAKANNLKFTIPVDVPGDTIRVYGVHGIPTTFFINREGIITNIKVGPFISQDEAEEMMASFQ